MAPGAFKVISGRASGGRHQLVSWDARLKRALGPQPELRLGRDRMGQDGWLFYRVHRGTQGIRPEVPFRVPPSSTAGPRRSRPPPEPRRPRRDVPLHRRPGQGHPLSGFAPARSPPTLPGSRLDALTPGSAADGVRWWTSVRRSDWRARSEPALPAGPSTGGRTPLERPRWALAARPGPRRARTALPLGARPGRRGDSRVERRARPPPATWRAWTVSRTRPGELCVQAGCGRALRGGPRPGGTIPATSRRARPAASPARCARSAARWSCTTR